MSNKDMICELFYSEHKQQQEIATAVKVSQQYVSKVIKADSRYKVEKENRKEQHAKQRKAKQVQYIKTKRQQEDLEYEYLKYLQNCNSREMSKRYLPNSGKLTKWEKAMYGIK